MTLERRHRPPADDVLVPARILNEHVYCPRLAWLEWEAGAFVDNLETVEGRVFGWMHALATTRRQLLALDAAGESAVLPVDSPHVLAWRRRHPRSGHLVGMVNFAEHAVSVDPPRNAHMAWHAIRTTTQSLARSSESPAASTSAWNRLRTPSRV